MRRGRQSVRSWNPAGRGPVTGAAGGWQDLDGTFLEGAMGRGRAQAHPRGDLIEPAQGTDRQPPV